jgi:hypothetical protein
MMNWKGFGRKKLWHTFKVLNKTTRNLSWDNQVEILAWDLPNMKQECRLLNLDIDFTDKAIAVYVDMSMNLEWFLGK